MIVVEFKEFHFMITLWALQGIIPKREKNKCAPFIVFQQDLILGFWHCFKKFLINLPMSCIKPIIASHFEMFFRYMLCQEFHEIQNRNGFLDIGIILVFIIMEGHIFTIVGINPGSGNDRPAKIAANIFNNGIRITQVRFGINVETIFVFAVNGSLSLFERRSDALFHFIKKDSLERLPKIFVVEIFYDTPEAIVRETAFSNQAMDMWVPFERAAECMKDTDKTWDKVFTFIYVVEHFKDYTAYSLKQAVE